MKDEKKKKKLSSDGMTTKEKMIARKKQLESKSNQNGFVYTKEGTLRIRIKSPGDDQELGIELIYFYLPSGSVYSPATFDEPCPFMEKYKELKESSNDDDKALAKLLVPKRKYVVGGIVYADEKGKSVDYNGQDKGILIPRQVYQDIVDLYLDEDEAGDMTDPINGYDIKIIRSGSGKFDTTYSARQCQRSKLDPKYRGTVNLEGIVRSQIKSYDELEELLDDFLKEDHTEELENEENAPSIKKDKKDKDKKKKKKFKSDI